MKYSGYEYEIPTLFTEMKARSFILIASNLISDALSVTFK